MKHCPSQAVALMFIVYCLMFNVKTGCGSEKKNKQLAFLFARLALSLHT